MAGRSVDLLIRVITDTKQAAAGMEKAGKSAEGMAGKLKAAALPAAAIGAGVVLFANEAVKSASRTQQAMGAVNSVFGASAGQVKKWSEQASTSVGLASSEYAELASVMGAQLKNMGVPLDQVAGKTNDLITMGADLAATYGGTTAEAVQALGSALRGETDPIERYGISIKQADIAARQAKDGTAKLTGEAGKQAKTAALLALATEQAGGAMGQFARETDSAAGSQQIATAQWEDAQAALGQALLPAMSTLAGVLGTVAGLIKNNSTLFMVIVGVVGAFAAAVLVANGAMSIYAAVTALAASATWAWLWPILAVIAAIALIVVGIILLWKKCDWFRNGVIAIWQAIVAAFKAVTQALKTAWLAIWPVLKAALRPFIAIFSLQFRLIAQVVRIVAAIIKEAFRVALWFIRLQVTAVRAVVLAAFNALRGPVTAVANTIKRVWESVFGALKRAASGMASALAGPFRVVENAVRAVIGAVESLIGWLGRIKVPKISLPKLPGFNATAAATAAPSVAATGMRAAATPTASSKGAGLTIVIQGAIDPEATARQVRRILAQHDRRVGGSSGLRAGLL